MNPQAEPSMGLAFNMIVIGRYCLGPLQVTGTDRIEQSSLDQQCDLSAIFSGKLPRQRCVTQVCSACVVP
jgi:hypothetical protein